MITQVCKETKLWIDRTYGGPNFSFTYLLFIKYLLRIMVFLVQGTDRENIEKKKEKKRKEKKRK